VTVWIAGIDAVVWAGWSLAVGTVAARLPDETFARDTWLTRPRRFEGRGRLYERFGVRRWKDRVPELGAFAGGRSKRTLPGPDDGGLTGFAAETRRAEYVHWSIAAAGPVFVLWNPPLLSVVMVAYAVFANVPCVAIQRYNRARVLRLVSRRHRAVAV
jgi:glycosyl-4,4'-diaponeurosporenoate acyltransferase